MTIFPLSLSRTLSLTLSGTSSLAPLSRTLARSLEFCPFLARIHLFVGCEQNSIAGFTDARKAGNNSLEVALVKHWEREPQMSEVARTLCEKLIAGFTLGIFVCCAHPTIQRTPRGRLPD